MPLPQAAIHEGVGSLAVNLRDPVWIQGSWNPHTLCFHLPTGETEAEGLQMMGPPQASHTGGRLLPPGTS